MVKLGIFVPPSTIRILPSEWPRLKNQDRRGRAA